MTSLALPCFEDVAAAASRLDGIVKHTPLISHPELDRQTGARVYLKCENLQLTGSFKIRGAYNRLAQLSDEQRKRGVVAFSSGNHAQGVARASKWLGMPAAIVMPSDAPDIKKAGVLADGAEIISYDRFTQSREEIAASIARKRSAVLVPSYDDPSIIAGQGTTGLEIANELSNAGLQANQLICCVGGGGLLSGIALAFETFSPSTELFGAEPADFDDHARSFVSGSRKHIQDGKASICDALLSPSPGELTFAINHRLLSGIRTVTDDDVRAAMRFAFRHLKLVVEPGGAAALAALLSGKLEYKPASVIVAVLTGGNVDPAVFAEIIREDGQ